MPGSGRQVGGGVGRTCPPAWQAGPTCRQAVSQAGRRANQPLLVLTETCLPKFACLVSIVSCSSGWGTFDNPRRGTQCYLAIVELQAPVILQPALGLRLCCNWAGLPHLNYRGR